MGCLEGVCSFISKVYYLAGSLRAFSNCAFRILLWLAFVSWVACLLGCAVLWLNISGEQCIDFEGFDYLLLIFCLGFKFFFLEIVACYLLSVFFFGCALLLRRGVWRVCVCALCSTNMVSYVAPVWLGRVHVGCGVVVGSHGVFYFVLYWIWCTFGTFPESSRCAACRASSGPFAFIGVSMWILCYSCVVVCVSKFVCGATCVILLGVFRSLVGQFFFGCLHLQWLFTMACGCGLCSTSFPGGHQVDGLPPASS